MRILVVDDEHELAEAIARGFRRHGVAVDIATDGAEGARKAASTRYDVAVVDRNLPEVSGEELCRRIVTSTSGTKVLMLSASRSVDDLVDGLNGGADDYLPKPFALSELVARVHALARRAVHATPPVLTRHGVSLDPGRHTVERAGVPVPLTGKEFGLLHALLRADGAVLSADELLETVWDEHVHPESGVLRVTIGNLRRKLAVPGFIVTVVGSGYRAA